MSHACTFTVISYRGVFSHESFAVSPPTLSVSRHTFPVSPRSFAAIAQPFAVMAQCLSVIAPFFPATAQRKRSRRHTFAAIAQLLPASMQPFPVIE